MNNERVFVGRGWYGGVEEEFACPSCQCWSRFEPEEEYQRCQTCGAFHETNILLADGWTL